MGRSDKMKQIRRVRKRRRTAQNNLSKPNPFDGFNKQDLLSKIACLNLIPDNQCRTVRLEIAQRMACTSKDGNRALDSKSLLSILNQHLPDDCFFAHQEDPVDILSRCGFSRRHSEV